MINQYTTSVINSSNIKYNLLTISLVFITTIIFGCAPSTNFIKTGKSVTAKSKNCSIEVFNSTTPERKFEELGILEIEGKFGYETLDKVLPKLKEDACVNGGDAIIIKTIQKYIDDSQDEKLYITATVIKWVN